MSYKSKNLSSELVIGMILLVAILMGVIFLFENGEIAPKRALNSPKNQAAVNENNRGSCRNTYFEGEAIVAAWKVQASKDDSFQIAIKNEDVSKLPVQGNVDRASNNYIVNLIDATEEVKSQLAQASKENPTNITVRGFAQGCGTIPAISLQQATTAFAKNKS